MREYMINLKGMKDGEHELDYALTSTFFKPFEYEGILSSDLNVEVDVIKRESHCEMNIEIFGVITVPCDRCLDPVEIECDIKAFLIVKFGNHFEEVDDELIIIPEKEGTINMSQYFYEYVLLSIPFQNVHPKGGCNKDMIKKLKEHSSISPEDKVDPRWNDLKSIIKNN